MIATLEHPVHRTDKCRYAGDPLGLSRRSLRAGRAAWPARPGPLPVSSHPWYGLGPPDGAIPDWAAQLPLLRKLEVCVARRESGMDVTAEHSRVQRPPIRMLDFLTRIRLPDAAVEEIGRLAWAKTTSVVSPGSAPDGTRRPSKPTALASSASCWQRDQSSPISSASSTPRAALTWADLRLRTARSPPSPVRLGGGSRRARLVEAPVAEELRPGAPFAEGGVPGARTAGAVVAAGVGRRIGDIEQTGPGPRLPPDRTGQAARRQSFGRGRTVRQT